MANLDLKKFLLGTSLMLSVSAFALPQHVYAQDTNDDDQVDVIEEDDEEEDTASTQGDTVVVTGSRLRRDTFTSVAPLQVITGQVSREVGLLDAASILQESTAATGQQIDTTFQGFVVDNGPGASTLNLRNLGSARALVLINGRRVAPAGVEGAPTSPDLNLIPTSLIDRFDILLDGASSVYGSDAVAGVVNAVLRSDFDGLEVEAFGEAPEAGAGKDYTLNLTYGKNFDRGFFGVGAEYRDSEAVSLADRDFTDQCDRHYEVTSDGQFRDLGIGDQVNNGMRANVCKRSGLAGRIIAGNFGSIYYTPGASNTGIGPNGGVWSESGLFSAPTFDVDFSDHIINGRDLDGHIFPDFKRFSLMGYGEYTFEGDMNITPFFEAIYSRRETFANSGDFQLFPVVPADNPFNPCNPNGIDGVDCGTAYANFLTSPAYLEDFRSYYFDGNNGGVTGCFGLPRASCTPAAFGISGGPSGPVTSQVVASVEGDRTRVKSEVGQGRVVVGAKGDLPQMNWGSLSNWGFETSLTYSHSNGVASRPGIRADRLQYSLSTSRIDPVSGEVVCGDPGDNECVPVNLFAGSLYDGVVGDFATGAERAYVFDTRDFETNYRQTVASGFLTGDIYELPAGPVGAVVGLEWRQDEIDSIPDAIARDGLFFGFFADGGAVGKKWTREAYGEIEVPILAAQPFATELTTNLSARFTEDEFYGSAWTYSGKVAYRPIDSLLLRATYGTSFRAPNLRENFLLGQTGFNTLFDPCVVPDGAFNPLTNTYDPALDGRDANTLANCVSAGVDPLTFNQGAGFSAYSVEISTGGALDLEEETSDSLSAGFTFEQPFFEAFDLTVGATYYKIEIEDAIVEPSAQFIINDCYVLRAGFASPFCSRVTRDAAGFIDLIDAGFINQDNETAEGIDINVRYNQDVTLFDRNVELGADAVVNHAMESSTLFVGDDGTEDFDDDIGEFGTPEWSAQVSLRADYDDYRLTWRTRYLGAVEQDADFIDPFGNAVDGGGDTCLGIANGDVDCRDVGFADEYFNHTVSLYYRGDTWTLGGGIRNVFDEKPPVIDTSEVLGVNNTPIGAGYDLDGRTFFLNVAKTFN